MSTWDLPQQGLAVWPVGNGDSITLALDEKTVIQIDINHRTVADDEEDPRVPVVDRLVEVLPLNDAGDPTLSVLAITHHDEDHCAGFDELLEACQVQELWVTLRSFVEDKDEEGLTEAGEAVYKEACRRRQAEIDAHAKGERPAPGDRLRIIGYHDVVDNADWKGFPEDMLTVPGNLIADINTVDVSEVAEFFVHTPFRDDTGDGSRNSSSLGLHVTLKNGDSTIRLLLLGDLEHKQIEAFYDVSVAENPDRLEWDLLLAPHHASRHAIRHMVGDDWENADSYEDLKGDAADGGVVVVSSRSFDEISDTDSNPPHTDAKKAYEGMVGAENVHWAYEYAKGSDSEPMTFTFEEGTVTLEEGKAERAAKLASIQFPSGAVVRPGDSSTGRGSQEFA
jgi:beta-lactamase superfamily II metal-dependent hydrolase